MPYDDKPRFSPWDDRSLPNMLPADEEARRVGAFIWIETRLAELTRAAAGKTQGTVADALTRHADHHAWHASVWADHLSRGKAPSSSSAPDGLSHVADLLDAVEAATDTLEILATLSRVIAPRVIAAYTFHRAAMGTDLGVDGQRWLDLVLEDAHDDRNELELYLQSIISTPDDVERIAKLQSRLEAPIVRAGGLLGPGTLGGDNVHVPSTVTPLRG